MSLFKRLFSADYRAALAAEAAGHLEQAAEHYALAGEHAEAARVHIARSERITGVAERIAALRDALHWAAEGSTLERRIYKHLGRALIEQQKAEGIATQRDMKRVREAAEMLVKGRDYARAGEAYESIGATQDAVAAYSKGGLVERMELALASEEERAGRARDQREAFANYEMNMRIGNRDAARDELRACLQAADKKGQYRRLLDELESRMITGGVVSLRRRHGPPVSAVAAPRVCMGRDNLCEMPLRAGGISREHAEISVGDGDAEPRFHLRDSGSKNGTLVAGLPIAGTVPLLGEGRFALGEHCSIDYRVTSGEGGAGDGGGQAHLVLTVADGMDRGKTLIAGGEDEYLDLMPLSELPVRVRFRDGRPLLTPRSDAVAMQLNDENVAHGEVQLIHGDQLLVDGVEVEVL